MPKIILPEYIQKLKEQIETGNNLVDYFFICGVSPSICMNEEIYNITDEDSIEKINQLLKPSILCKFPEFDKTIDIVDDEIISYCFPDGFNIIKNDSSYPNRKIFSIILDNNLFSQDYPQKYLTCILFYEKLYQYKTLQQQIKKIEENKEYFSQNEENITLDDFRTSLEEEKKINIHRHQKMVTSSMLPSMLKRSAKIKEDTIKQEEKPKNFANEEIIKNNKNLPLNKLKYYYIPKCICLVSVHPNIKLYQKILLNIYNYGLSQNNDIPLEKIITNLIIEVPVPPRGMYSIYYNYDFKFTEPKKEKNGFEIISNTNYINNINETPMNINMRAATQYKSLDPSTDNEENQIQPLKSTENNKILVTGIDLNKFNTSLSFSCKMETIKHILCNTKILFFSLNLNYITETIMAFLNLIFPFKYPFQVVTTLQKTSYRIIESISPFIAGINEEYRESFFEENKINLELNNLFVVDLDNMQEKNYHLFSEEEFPEFPAKLLSNLEKEIRNLENSANKDYGFDKSKKINKEKKIKDFNEKYQEKFFIFFCEMLKGYEEFLNRDFYKEDLVSITTLFNCPQFVKSSYHSQNDADFYIKFIEESQLFQEFIFKNMVPKNNNELMDILIVNNYLNPSKKKKTKTEEDPYTIKNKYIVPRPKEITDDEKSKILSNILNLSKKGQIIKNRKYENKENIGTIKFDYTLFPVLDFNNYCNNDNVNQYIPPPDYREEIEVLNMEAISKSSLGKNINRAMEMKNYLYLTWLEIWAFTFGNNDFGEKHYRFDQMLDVLDKVIHHEMNILNLMFDILNKYDEHEMMLRLYQKLLQLKLNPSTTIFDIMSKIVDKSKMKDMADETKKNTNNVKQLKFNDETKKNRDRTFLSISDNLPLETKPKFYYDYCCLNIECNKKINLYNVSKNFEGVKNDILWVKCNNCGEYNLPKITVKFGLNFLNKSTSIEDYVLHSPYNLKMNIKQAVATQFGSDMKNTKFKLKISNFKSQFQPLFWDFIWYCIIHNLDYNILLPYSKTLEEEKKAHYYNPNINLFEIKYDDSMYKDNQTKIEKISNTIIKRSSEEDKKKFFKTLEQCNKVCEVQIKGKNSKINILKEKNEIIEEEDDGNNSVDYKDNENEKGNNDNENNDLENNIMNNMNMIDLMKDNNEDDKEDDKEENNDENKDNNSDNQNNSD